MEKLRKNMLLGINKETKEIYFGEIEITTRNNYKEFTASFDVGEAFDIEEIDLTEESQNQWDCLDNETKLDLLYDGDRTREDVFDEWTRYNDYHDFIDCSCTDIEIEIENGTIINFRTTCGGQHDIREDEENYKNIIFTDKTAVEKILNLWDLYHLKNITEHEKEIEKEIKYILDKIGMYTMYSEKTENFIKEYIKEL